MSGSVLLKNVVGVHETKRGPYLVTYTGKKFFPMDVQARDIDVLDIAHALANMCRFGGHTSQFYSVAQHSVLVSLILPDDLKLRGLLHDASEAYLVDVPRPLKKIADFSAYRRIERETQGVIYRKFGINDPAEPQLIHDADNLALATEARDLMGDPSWAKDMEKLKLKIVPWSPENAEFRFMKKFEELSK
jgi:uncharacterized protein